MHLQKAVEGYDVFARSLSIGAGDDGDEVPARAADARPLRGGARVPDRPTVGDEVVTISRLVNAFFRWEFNSCEKLVAGAEVHPIDYANACPDVALTSLHYYFPWAMAALVRWTRVLRGHRAAGRGWTSTPRRYFAIADRDDLSYGDKLAALPPAGRRVLRDRPLPRLLREPAGATSTRSCSTGSTAPDFDAAAASTRCAATYRPAEHDRFIAHFRGCWSGFAMKAPCQCRAQ